VEVETFLQVVVMTDKFLAVLAVAVTAATTILLDVHQQDKLALAVEEEVILQEMLPPQPQTVVLES
jgi:hypothetical protein